MKTLYVLMTLGAGMLLPLQAAMNSTLRRHIGHPLWAAVWNFAGGLLVLLTLCALLGARPASPASVALGAPWWTYAGGLCGAAIVMTGVLGAPRLGAALLMASLLAGQLLSSLLFDHMGWLNYPERPIGLGRLAGVALLAAGVWLIHRY